MVGHHDTIILVQDKNNRIHIQESFGYVHAIWRRKGDQL